MNTESFIFYIKREDIYSDIAKDVETRFDNSNYELDRPFLKGKNKKVISLMKDELSGKIRKGLATLRAKTYRYLTGSNDEDKKAKGTKNCVVKRKLKFEDYKHYLDST